MELREVRLNDPEVLPLLAGLTEEYERRYGPVDEMSSVTTEEFDPPGGAFVVLLEEGETIAGGGFRRLSATTCEVKRMWTAPDHRRSGHATTVLSALERIASERGYLLLRLETGPAQPEAQAMYLGPGYRPIPPFGRYELASAFEYPLRAVTD